MIRKLLITLFVTLLFIPLVSAREFMSSTDCEVTSEDVQDGLLLVLCENLKISGEINGDLIGAALRTEIDGTINGNIYLLSGQLDVWGYVAGDLHFAGPVLRLNPPKKVLSTDGEGEFIEEPRPEQRLEGGVKAMTLTTTIFDTMRIEDDVMNFGYQLLIDGHVNSEVNFWGSLLYVDGEINGNVYANVGDPDSENSQLETLLLPLNFDLSLQNPGLIVTEQGRIQGDLHYTGPQTGITDGEVSGETVFEKLDLIGPALDEPGTITLYIEAFGREFTTLLVIGLLALASMNNLLHVPLDTMRARPFASVAVGMLAFLLSFPVILIILLLSLLILGFIQLIGLSGVVLALSVVLGLVNLGGISVFYFVAIFLARTLVALWIGRSLLGIRFNRRRLEEVPLRFLALVVGIFLLSLIVSLPIIGILFNALALFSGLGAILMEVITEFNKLRDDSAVTTSIPAWYTRNTTANPQAPPLPSIKPSIDIPPVLSPPPVEDRPLSPTPGADNLPDGFDWSFFEE